MNELPEKSDWIKIIIGIVVILIIVIIFLNVLKTQVPYSDRVCNDVQVPYSDHVCENNPYAYNVEYAACTKYSPGFLGIGYQPATVICKVNNLENKAGIFNIQYGLIIAGTPITKSESTSIYASSSTSKTYTYAGEASNCICGATPPMNQVCRDIIRYKTEKQCNDVTKYRTVSIWQSLF